MQDDSLATQKKQLDNKRSELDVQQQKMLEEFEDHKVNPHACARFA